jgi:riboflavin synthase
VFTGIIQHVGTVIGVAPTPAGKRLRIDLGPLAVGLAGGASVAVDGACLTASASAGPPLAEGGRATASAVEFDVVPETLSRTTLGRLGVGARVNLERALRAGAALDGHIVQGHVDGVARVHRLQRQGGQVLWHLSAGRELTDQMVPKGAIALAGVSLTLVAVAAESFSVALIPTTLERTTLGELRVGEEINVEVDILGKYVRRYLAQMTAGESGGLTWEKLRSAGFM